MQTHPFHLPYPDESTLERQVRAMQARAMRAMLANALRWALAKMPRRADASAVPGSRIA